MSDNRPGEAAGTGSRPGPGDWQADALSGFPAEAEVAAAAARARRVKRAGLTAGGLGVLALAALGWLAPEVWYSARVPWRHAPASEPPRSGVLTVESAVPGLEVREGDRSLGVTPLTTSLAPGEHVLTLAAGETERQLVVVVPAGGTVVHHVEIGQPPTAGTLRVETSPPGAAVEVDGAAAGTTPTEIPGLRAGEHDVTVREGGRAFSRKVVVAAGGVASLVVPLPPRAEATAGAGAGAGWLRVSSAIELQLYEGESLVGTSRMPRVMLSAGRRVLRLVNAAAAFDVTSRVDITPGEVTDLRVDLPLGRLSVNAVPWAEVFLDGRAVGATPIANLEVRIGPHELVLRHPRYPEHRRAIVVSMAGPLRIGVDLRQ